MAKKMSETDQAKGFGCALVLFIAVGAIAGGLIGYAQEGLARHVAGGIGLGMVLGFCLTAASGEQD